MRPPTAAALTALALWAGWGCAYPAVTPLEFLEPSPLPDGSVAFGSARITARAGPEWIEVRVRNEGETPLMVDWTASTFTTPGGHVHRLFSAAQLWEFAFPAADAFLRLQGDPAMPVNPWSRGNPTAFGAAAEHGVSETLRTLPPARLLLAPRGDETTILYPAEHVILDPFGFHVRPLVCEAEGGAGEGPFVIGLRVAQDGWWRDVVLRGRLVSAPLTANTETAHR